MSVGAPFTQKGNNCVFTANVSGSVPTPVHCITNDGPTALGAPQYILTNTGSVTVWVGYGKDAATATANAVVPTGDGSNSVFCYCLLGPSQITITAGPNAYFTGITGSSTALVSVVPGDGT